MELTDGWDVLAVDLLVTEIVVIVLYHHLAPDHLPTSSSPRATATPHSSSATPHPTTCLRLLSLPGGERHGDTDRVGGEKIATLGPHRDVLGVEVSNAGQVHQGMVT